MRRVYDFLFGSEDLPAWLQVFWKVLLFFMASVLVLAALGTESTLGAVVILIIASVIALAGVFTKLGEK